MQSLHLEVFVNGSTTGLITEFKYYPDGRFGVAREELLNSGIKVPGTERGDEIALDDVPGLQFSYDEAQQRMSLTVAHENMVPKVYSPQLSTQSAPELTSDWGAVVNYSLFAAGSLADYQSLSHPDVASAQFESRVFSPYGHVVQTGVIGATLLNPTEILRYDTTYLFSHSDTSITYAAGDVISRGVSWARPVRLGGLQVSRNFALRPDLVTVALPSFTGSAAVPSTVEVYVNNVRTFSQDVGAGPFEVKDLPLISGSGTARLVVRDVTGREVETTLPFFSAATILRPGLFDFAAQVGYPRLGYGKYSFSYDDAPVGVGSLRYGVGDSLTVEAHGEVSRELVNVGFGIVTNATAAGVLSVAVRGSQVDGERGYEGSASFNTKLFGMAVSLGAERAFGAFSDLASISGRMDSSKRKTRWYEPEATGSTQSDGSFHLTRSLERVSVGFPIQPFGGSFSFSFINLNDTKRVTQLVSANYSRSLWKKASLSINAFGQLGDAKSAGVFASFSMPLGDTGVGLSAGTRWRGDQMSSTVRAQKSIGHSIGSIGYSVEVARGERSTQYSATGAYRSEIASVRASAKHAWGELRGTLEADGAIVLTSSGITLGNRVSDAFAVVDVGAPDIEVTHQNRTVGRTGYFGRILVPTLVPYQPNTITINTGNLPVGAQVAKTQEVVTPAAGSGVNVDLSVRTDGRAAIVIIHDHAGKPLPAATLGRLEGAEDADAFMVGHDGQAYITGLSAENVAILTIEEAECRATFAYEPQGDEQVIIGPVTCAP